MRPLLFAIFFTLASLGSTAVLIPCPKLCKCEYGKNTLEAKCTSQKFLYKIDEKQAVAFESLDLSNTSLKVLDKRLKILVNLKNLDLSNNQLDNILHFPALNKLEKLSLAKNSLKEISFSSLPKSLKDLDLSSNHILGLPKDWQYLQHLSSLHIHNNPINCDDDSINRFVNLVSIGAHIPETVMCQSPKKSHGKTLQSLITDVLLNPMLGDQDEPNETEEDVEKSEFIKHTPEKSEQTMGNLQGDLFEGSGNEEGSGDVDIVSSACVIDCTTFKPLDVLKDNNNTSPLLSIKEQVGILFEDLFGKEQDEPSTSPNPTAAEKLSTPVEEIIPKKTVTEVMNEPKTTKKTEKLVVSADGSKDVKDLERASLSNDENANTYYLIATIIVLMIVVAIFIIIKKKSTNGKRKRRRNSMAENGICEEMKPLGKYKDASNGASKENKENEIRPERIPLMNGQNGKSEPASNKGSSEDIDVTLRSPLENGGSSPKPERVTITASEIPPNILKTPQLVHRQLNSDGEIVTKPLDDSY